MDEKHGLFAGTSRGTGRHGGGRIVFGRGGRCDVPRQGPGRPHARTLAGLKKLSKEKDLKAKVTGSLDGDLLHVETVEFQQ